MDLGFVADYISPIALVVCLGVGYIVKNVVPSDAVNRWIPCIVAALGVAIVAWSEWGITPQVLATGLISGLASTGLYEAFANLINKERA